MAKTDKDTKDNEQQLQEAQSRKSSYEYEKSSKQNTLNSNNNKISRLKTVKSKLETEKSNAKSKASSIKTYVENADNYGGWYDDLATKIQGDLQGTVVTEYNNYVDRIDEVLDDVCDEITRLENEKMQLNWDILRLGSAINSLINEIRTLCN